MMFLPKQVRVLTPCGWRDALFVHPTVELSPETWRARLEDVFKIAEGRAVAGLVQQEEGQ